MRGNRIVVPTQAASTNNKNTPLAVLITMGWLKNPKSGHKLFQLEKESCQLIFRFTSKDSVAPKQGTQCTTTGKWFVPPKTATCTQSLDHFYLPSLLQTCNFHYLTCFTEPKWKASHDSVCLCLPASGGLIPWNVPL